MPDTLKDQVSSFAGCLGRYSAMREYAWMMGQDGTHWRAEFDTFSALYDAVFPMAQQAGLRGEIVLDMRIRAKFEQRRLMDMSQFQTDPRHRRIAAAQAKQRLASCRSLIS